MAKRDKKDYIENLAEKAEEARPEDAVAKTFRGGYRNGNMPVKDKNGRQPENMGRAFPQYPQSTRT